MAIKDAPPASTRNIPTSKSGRRKGGGGRGVEGVMRAFNPFDSAESVVEEIEERSIPSG
eukprot:CAMPEP_0113597588 /NCGR_PEP_ID=MMETSP0015_2-20120614/41098_1 /TAXON_ID=2838 /ORGANISM="Odontella" /LENGTH=58 /DNA_ID=CAMNT_0000505477 /DNA_START=751 /DNA_END=924 /DNA_ORIENTATION=+ /assembly_acc=CAM_ASM_000160